VLASPLTREAISYAWRQLLTRAGAAQEDGLVSLSYGEPSAGGDAPQLLVTACDVASWGALLARSPHSLQWLPVESTVPPGARLPFDAPIPVLFWGQTAEGGEKPFAEHCADGTVRFNADILAAAFFMLSRWEETVVPTRDQHGRFPDTASVAYQQGFLGRPIVDEYALILREWLKVARPRWSPARRCFTVRLTHDIDKARHFASLYYAARAVAGDVIKRHSLKQAWQTLTRTVEQTAAPLRLADFQGIYLLAELSRQYGMRSAFYFMAADPGPMESDYEITSVPMRSCIEDLRAWGFEIGFHPGYRTFRDPARLALERARLDAVLGHTDYGGRQHYLRFQVPVTWRHWEEAGLTYDSTMSYADQEGFRCGTCHAFQPFDVERNRELHLTEWPLVVMDVTLRNYRLLTPEQAEARILELAQRCRQVEGTFTLLWHNSSLFGDWQPWAEVYRRVVQTLAAMESGRASLCRVE
jgi:hypothetical protein